jgi:outer membrane protein assembly factor BamD
LIWKVLVLSATVLLLVGCAVQESKTFPDPRDQYEYAKEKYEEGKYDTSVLAFQKVLFSYPGLSYVDSAQYWFAMSYYGREDYHLAAAEFRRLITNFPGSELADDAQFMIGKAYFEAAPDDPGLDQTDTKDAIKQLEAFLEDYPLSDRRQDGEELLLEARERIVTKQFRAAEQYRRLGNNQAARIYFEDIVTEHSYSRLVPKALFQLAEIDVEQKQYEEARDKLNNLMQAFPEHELVDNAARLKESVRKKLAAGDGPESAAVDTSDANDQ